MTKKAKRPGISLGVHYESVLGDISNVIDAAKSSAARSVNCIMTAAYWLIGRRIVESEQKGEKRAAYGEELLERLSADLSKSYGRGFSRQNLQQMRQFYILYLPEQICQTPSGESARTPDAMICQPPSGILQTLSEDDIHEALKKICLTVTEPVRIGFSRIKSRVQATRDPALIDFRLQHQ